MMGHGSGTAPRAGGPDPAPESNTAEAPSTAAQSRAREQRLAARGDRILDALATLIARWGYGKTTVDEIAREAGVAKGTVYLHWPTKVAMLHAMIEREERAWAAHIAERMAADPRGGTLSSLYYHALMLYVENPLLRALHTMDHDILGEWTRSPQSRARYRQRMEELLALIMELRSAGVMQADLPARMQAYLVVALSYGVLMIDEVLPAEFVPPLAEVAGAVALLVQRSFEHEMAAGEQALARGQTAIAVVRPDAGERESAMAHKGAGT